MLGNQSGSWRPYWEHLFHLVAQAVPSDWFVLVLAERGLYSRWLFQLIRQKEWHPFLRINGQGFFCPQGESYRPLWSLAPHPGTYWWGVGTCFKTYPLHCTLLAVWGEESQEPWFTPNQADAAWYGLPPVRRAYAPGLKVASKTSSEADGNDNRLASLTPSGRNAFGLP